MSVIKRKSWILTEVKSKLNKIQHASVALDCDVKYKGRFIQTTFTFAQNLPCETHYTQVLPITPGEQVVLLT